MVARFAWRSIRIFATDTGVAREKQQAHNRTHIVALMEQKSLRGEETILGNFCGFGANEEYIRDRGRVRYSYS